MMLTGEKHSFFGEKMLQCYWRHKKFTNFGSIPDFRYETPADNNFGHVTPFEDGRLNS
jgi:hypothetical protein